MGCHCFGKWKLGQPAVPWWFDFDPHPSMHAWLCMPCTVCVSMWGSLVRCKGTQVHGWVLGRHASPRKKLSLFRSKKTSPKKRKSQPDSQAPVHPGRKKPPETNQLLRAIGTHTSKSESQLPEKASAGCKRGTFPSFSLSSENPYSTANPGFGHQTLTNKFI